MSEFDVRLPAPPVSVIKFADAHENSFASGFQITLNGHGGGNTIAISDDQGDFVLIHSKETAVNLIKAVNKAIELSWLK